MQQEKANRLWRKLFGWRVGDRVQVHGKTKIMYGMIEKFITVAEINGNDRRVDIPSAIVCYDGKIRRTQVISIDVLEIEGENTPPKVDFEKVFSPYAFISLEDNVIIRASKANRYLRRKALEKS